MRLSDLNIVGNDKLLTDGDFDIFAMLFTSSKQKKIFSYLNDEKYLGELLSNNAVSCIVCKRDMLDSLPEHVIGVIVSENPGETFWKLHESAMQKLKRTRTTIGEDCVISELAYIAKNNVSIGNHVIIEEFVSIKEGTIIGDNCIIRAGSIVGGSGLHLQLESNGKYRNVGHFGKVILEDDIEIQQNVCVDRAVFAWDSTIIGEGTKIGGLTLVGHAAKIGKNCCLTAGIIIGGSTRIKDNVWIGLNSSVKNSLVIGDNAWISICGVVTRNIGQNGKVIGNYPLSPGQFMEDIENGDESFSL